MTTRAGTQSFLPGSSDAATLAAALVAGRDAVAEAWPRELLTIDPGALAVSSEAARALVDAIVAALGDDLAPLAAATGLEASRDDPAMVVDRLDEGLRRVDAVRRVCAADPALRDAIPVADLTSSFATVSRLLAIQATAMLAGRTAAAEERAHTGTSSIAVTMHELRRPLTVLSSYAQLLDGGLLGELEPRAAEAAATMVSAAEVMSRLVEALGAVAHLEDPDEPTAALAELEVDAIVATAVDVVSLEAGARRVRFEVESCPDLRVRGDRERLTLALTNLLSNAVKHTDDGDRVEIRARRDGQTAHIAVRDHGPGLPPKAATKLFDKWYRDPGERERGTPGTGLGLYIVWTVMARHGGRVAARPAPGGGAEFELSLAAL